MCGQVDPLPVTLSGAVATGAGSISDPAPFSERSGELMAESTLHSPEGIVALDQAKEFLDTVESILKQYNDLVTGQLFDLGYNLPFVIGLEGVGRKGKSLTFTSGDLHTFIGAPTSKEERRRQYLGIIYMSIVDKFSLLRYH